MTAMVKGWCPGVLRPMESGDGLIVRLKISGGIISLGLAAEIATWSAAWGNGEIDLTSRGNLQLRGVSAESLPSLQAALAEQGLLDGNVGGEAVRNVISSPLAGIDPAALLDIRPLVKALDARLAGDAALHALPAKFGFLIDDGGCLKLAGIRADVRFEAVAGPAFAVGLDGSDARFGPVRPERLVEVAAALAGIFLTHQGVRRMRDLVARIGAAAIAGEAGLALLVASPLEGEGGGYVAPIGMVDMLRQHPPAAAVAASASIPRGEALILGIGLPFGRISSGALVQLANSAAAELRLTPWRVILLPMPSVSGAQALSAELVATGLILDPADPRLHVVACAGKPSCIHATIAVRDDATRLAGLVGGPGVALHVSGCAKGCAHPHSAPVTLVGRDGLYDVVHGGCATDSPQLMGLTLDEAAGHLREMAARYPQGGTA